VRARTLPTGLCLLAATCAFASPADRAPSFGRSLYYYTGLQGRVLWVDGTANLDRITTRQGVADIVARSREARLTTLVVDAKPVSGQVLYSSSVSEPLRAWRGREYPVFDVVNAFVEEGHRAGLEVAATINTFTEGHKMFGVGLGYRKPDWQSMVYVIRRTLHAPDGAELRVRAVDDPEEAQVTTVHQADFVVEPSQVPEQALAVVLEAGGRVSGMIDPALLGSEPLVAPEDGHLLLLYSDARDWATSHLRAGDRSTFRAAGKLMPVSAAPSERIAVFVNPLHPDARAHELAVIREIVERYPVDTLVLDRMRYASIYADFSPLTRRTFEGWLGRPLARWPQDVLDVNPIPGEPVLRGPYYKRWLEFRARVIRDFLAEARQVVRTARPGTRVAAYVGSWFPSYYGVGVNWASEKYPVTAAWATPAYGEAGYAEHLDWLTTGCYYGVPTRDQARALGSSEGATVETAAVLSTRVAANALPVYAGVYALNYEGRPNDFAAAIEVCVKRSAGVMLFDVSHIYDYGWWPIVAQAFSRSAFTPHECPGLTAQLRAAHDAVVALGDVDSVVSRMPVVPYQLGGG